MTDFKLKAVQLDLARQMETVDFIKSFIDMLADNGYNALMLYLEDRVRTASYPYPEEGEAYTEEEIRSLVRYGEEKGIELFPCVATLGHAERFLRHKELVKLAKVQDGMTDRFGGHSKQVFCINHPDFYPFIEKYISEVAALFPSKYFHAGLDEFWDFNLCERCRKVMHTHMDEEMAFVRHVVRINDLLKKLGKRMMMWSDMFEFYTDIMPLIPKEVIMADWQYQTDVRFYQGHLLDQRVEDRYAVNEKLGFETVFSPADRPFTNAVSYLHYAERKKALGFFVTNWEKTDTFHFRHFPLFCTIGRMLRGETQEQAFAGAVRYLFGTDDPVLANTLKAAVSMGFLRHFGELGNNVFFARSFEGLRQNIVNCNLSLLALWDLCREKIRTETGLLVWQDIRNALTEKKIGNELKQIFQDAFDFGYVPEHTEQTKDVRKEMSELLDDLSSLWQKVRPGIAHNVFEDRRAELLKRIDDKTAILPCRSFVRTRYCLPDQYGVGRVSIRVHTEKGWTTVAENGCYKSDYMEALYEYVTPAVFEGTPDMVQYEVYGMGGQGICFSEVHDSSGKRYFPCGIAGIHGIVEHPEFLLENDVNFAWFGSQSTRDAYWSENAFGEKHCVTLLLKEAE